MQQIRHQLINEMHNFIKGDAEAEYTVGHVERCNQLLENFEHSMQPGISEAEALAEVKTLIQALNQLNDDCFFSLIEAPAREEICVYVAAGLAQANVKYDGDATAEWRDW